MINGVSSVFAEARHAHPTRRSVVKGAAWATPLVAASVAAPAFAASPTCEGAYLKYDSNARGIFLSGTLLSTNLSNVAEIQSAHAEASMADAWQLNNAGLVVGALGDFLNVDLTDTGVLVSSILTTLTDQDLGALNQFAYADENVGAGNSAAGGFDGTNSGELGAAGTLNNSTGAVNFAEGDASAPGLGSLNLRAILERVAGNNAVTGLLNATAGLNLDVGALFGKAFMDLECIGSDEELVVDREYLIASLKLLIESDLVGDVVTGLSSESIGAGLSSGVLGVLFDVPVVGPALRLLDRVLNLSNLLTVDVNVDLSQLTAHPIPDESSAGLQLDLSASTIVLNLEDLLNGGINGHIPNTRLFVDAPLLDEDSNDGVTPIQQLVNSLVESLVGRLQSAVTVTITLNASALALAAVSVNIQGTLAELLSGDGTATITVAGVPIDATNLTRAVGGIVDVVLDGIVGDGGVLGPTLDGIENEVLGNLLTVLTSVLVLTVNAQNDPEVGNSSFNSPPSAYAGTEIEDGRYDVAALYLGLLDRAQVLNLSLARGSVGPNAPR